MPLLQAGTHRLFVEITGTGAPVLLLHGFPDDLSIWGSAVDTLVAAGCAVGCVCTVRPWCVVAGTRAGGLIDGLALSRTPRTTPDTRYRCIVPNMLGYASAAPGSASDRPSDPAAYGLGQIAAGLAAMLDGLGVARAAVIGHDW